MDFIEHWHIWLVVAFLILIVELMSGTYFLLAVAGGALLTSLITGLFDPTITMQLLSMGITSAVTYLIMLSFRQKKSVVNTDGTAHMLGQEVLVIETIKPRGRVSYKGVSWQAKSDAVIEADSYAEIIAVDGSTLTVQPIHNKV